MNFTVAMGDVNYSLVNQITWPNSNFGASSRTSVLASQASGNAQIRTGFLNASAIFEAEDISVVCVGVFR
mgnify:CR=1 FL=1